MMLFLHSVLSVSALLASPLNRAIPVQVSDPEINSVQAQRCSIAAQMPATKMILTRTPYLRTPSPPSYAYFSSPSLCVLLPIRLVLVALHPGFQHIQSTHTLLLPVCRQTRFGVQSRLVPILLILLTALLRRCFS